MLYDVVKKICQLQDYNRSVGRHAAPIVTQLVGGRQSTRGSTAPTPPPPRRDEKTVSSEKCKI